jgi:hypothetical protein
MSILVYLIQVNMALLFCWALYRVAFRKLTFFQWNRYYLMGSVVLSLFLPLLRLPQNSPAGVADLGAIDWSYVDHFASTPVALTPYAAGWSPRWILLFVYAAVALIFLIRSGWKLRHLFGSLGPCRRIAKGRVKVYVHDQRMGSFTLFRRVYLDRYAYENQSAYVLRHEMAHAVQLHSLDLLFMELLTDLLWFNPVSFVLLRYMKENHEFLADRYAHGGRNSLAEYLECLKAETIREFAPVPASYFKSTTIKKRILMLTNHSTDRKNLWRYLGIIPVVAILVGLFQTPATRGQALTASLAMEEALPSVFPLPEAYKEKITWGYHQKAKHPITKQETMHLGIDVAAPRGTQVSAAGEGVVRKAAYEEGWGKLVVIEHDKGFATFYAHLDEIAVEKGMKVAVGQAIGKVGNTGQSTGPHLHYEVRKNGEHVNPADYY